MQNITPPQRWKDIASDDADMDEDITKDSETIFSTPVARDKKGFSWHSRNGEAASVTVPSASTIPATPQTSLESNDGSHIKTPFANFVPWSADSPDIVGTPTPNGITSKGESKRIFPAIGGSFIFPTPQYPPDLASFVSRQGPESPIAAKVRASQSKEYKESPTTMEGASSRSLTPEEAQIKPLVLTTEPGQPALHPVPLMALDDDDRPESPNIESPAPNSLIGSPIIATEEQDNMHKSPLSSLSTDDSMKPVVEIPAGILKWLEPPSLIHAAKRLDTGRDRARREETTRRRLAGFMRSNAIPTLEPVDHAYGRVLKPRAKDKTTAAAPEWPDDVYPWSSSPLSGSHVSPKRRRELKMIANYLDNSSESEDEADIPTGQVDPSDALLAFRNKTAVRRWMQKQRETPQPPEAPSPVPETSVDAEVESVMDVDKDSGEVACICRKPDDGRLMVQCDSCKTWHHAECVSQNPDNLPEQWFCWKCPAPPSKAVPNIVEPTFSVAGSPAKPRYSGANVPLYQAPANSSQSPRRNSHPQTHLTPSSLLEPGTSSLFGDRKTPSPLRVGFPGYAFAAWPDPTGDLSLRPDKLDDPMTAIAATPFSGVGFMHIPYDDPILAGLNGSPSRPFGLRFTPFYATTPKKERPWTNYTGTFGTPAESGSSQSTSAPSQPFPAVQTDPLFIHYEHDAASKKTTQRDGAPTKGKRKAKGKAKGKQTSVDRMDESSQQEAARAEANDTNTNETSASEHTGDTPPPPMNDETTQEVIEIKIEAPTILS